MTRRVRKIRSRFNKFIAISILHFVFITIFTTQINAQYGATPMSLAKGRSAGSYQLSDIENINYFTGRLNISIPLAGIKGRGETGYSVSANLSPSWKIRTDSYEGNQIYIAENDGAVGNITGFPKIEARRTFGANNSQSCGGSEYLLGVVTRIYVTMGDGAEYELRDVLTNGQPLNMQNCNQYPNRGRHFVSRDGSEIMYISDNDVHDNGSWIGNGYLIFKNGTTLRVTLEGDTVVTKLTDRNGNFTSFTGGVENGLLINHITDSIGRDTSIHPNYWYDPAEPGFVKYKGTGGQNRQSTVTAAMLSDVLVPGERIRSLADLFHEILFDSSQEFNGLVMSAVTLPNGQSYHFKYNSYGEIAGIEFPTGSVVEYTWASGAEDLGDGGLLYPPFTPDPFIYRRVVERRVYDDGVNLTSRTTISRPETYNNSNGTFNNVGYVDVKTYTPQLAAFERHYYYGQASANFQYGGGYTPWKTGKEYKTEVFSPQNSNILRTTYVTWQQTNPTWCSNCGDNAPTNNPKVTDTITILGDSNQFSKKTFTYDNFNNLTDTYEYDYSSGAPGAFLRRSHTDYLTTNPVNNIDYTSDSVHILGLPTQSWVSSDAAGNNKVSLIQYEYDNYATDTNHAALVNRTNIIGHDSNYGTNYTTRGNVTKITSYENANNQTGAISSYRQYDIAGNPVKGIDAKGYVNTMDYSDNFGSPNAEARTNSAPSLLNEQQTFAFPTSSTNQIGYTSYAQFDYYTSGVVDAEDLNGNVSSMFYNDILDRPTQTIAVNNRSGFRNQATIVYDDVNRKVTTTSDSKTFGDNLIKSESFYDKMGRTFETRQYESASVYIAGQQQYDALGRAFKSSNPVRCTVGSPPSCEQIEWTTTSFDDLGRVIEVKTPDNAKVTRTYYGTSVQVFDQTNRSRAGVSDALGRLTKVVEYDTGADLETLYTYDVLGRLRKTTQVDGATTQNRYFMYDDLGRLIRAKQPEQTANTNLALTDAVTGNSSWSVKYVYDNNGNVVSTTDANNRTVAGTYDTLNRLTLRDYSDATPDVTFTFDNPNIPNSKGQLTQVSSSVSQTNFTVFDELGRIKSSSQTTSGQTYNFPDYSYDLSGAMVAQTYPSGRIVRTESDNIGRLSKVTSQKVGDFERTQLSQLSYTSFGAISQAKLGNGRWENTQFDSKRLQIKQIGLGASAADTTLLKLEYAYGTTDNNGSLREQKITVQGMSNQIVQSYTYDALNRLKSATETPVGSSQSWKQTFDYDRFGNRRFDAANTTTLPANNNIYNPNIEKSNNQFKVAEGYNYDNEGNLTSNPESQLFQYDAENRQTQVQNTATGTTANYFYDGSGKRVKKVVGNQETIFVYDAFGKLVAEYTLNQTITNNGTQYLTVDALGSPRAITNNLGQVASRHDYLPFGEEVSAGTGGRTTTQGYGAVDKVRQQFTGYERDVESGLDYAQARYFASRHGRFTSVDPLDESADIKSPQTFNRYSYAMNSPYKFVDPTGLYGSDISCGGNTSGGGQGSTLGSCESQRSLEEHEQRLENTLDAAAVNRAVANNDQPTADAICARNSNIECSKADGSRVTIESIIFSNVETLNQTSISFIIKLIYESFGVGGTIPYQASGTITEEINGLPLALVRTTQEIYRMAMKAESFRLTNKKKYEKAFKNLKNFIIKQSNAIGEMFKAPRYMLVYSEDGGNRKMTYSNKMLREAAEEFFYLAVNTGVNDKRNEINEKKPKIIAGLR